MLTEIHFSLLGWFHALLAANSWNIVSFVCTSTGIFYFHIDKNNQTQPLRTISWTVYERECNMTQKYIRGQGLGDDKKPRKASPALKHVFHWVWCWQSRDSWRTKRRHSFSLGTEGCSECVPQHLDGDPESLNSNRILSIQFLAVQIQTERSLGTTALRHLAETKENTRQSRHIQGSLVSLWMISHI